LSQSLSPDPRATSTYAKVTEWIEDENVDILRQATAGSYCACLRHRGTGRQEDVIGNRPAFLYGQDLPDVETRWWGGGEAEDKTRDVEGEETVVYPSSEFADLIESSSSTAGASLRMNPDTGLLFPGAPMSTSQAPVGTPNKQGNRAQDRKTQKKRKVRGKFAATSLRKRNVPLLRKGWKHACPKCDTCKKQSWCTSLRCPLCEEVCFDCECTLLASLEGWEMRKAKMKERVTEGYWVKCSGVCQKIYNLLKKPEPCADGEYARRHCQACYEIQGVQKQHRLGVCVCIECTRKEGVNVTVRNCTCQRAAHKADSVAEVKTLSGRESKKDKGHLKAASEELYNRRPR
jgi:hypothetical protein